MSTAFAHALPGRESAGEQIGEQTHRRDVAFCFDVADGWVIQPWQVIFWSLLTVYASLPPMLDERTDDRRSIAVFKASVPAEVRTGLQDAYDKAGLDKYVPLFRPPPLPAMSISRRGVGGGLNRGMRASMRMERAVCMYKQCTTHVYMYMRTCIYIYI